MLSTTSLISLQQTLHLRSTYVCIHWHHSCIFYWEHLESIQKQAVHIFSFTHGMSYPNVLFVANLNSLKDRRDQLLQSFFQNMCKPASSFHHLFPPPRNTSAISRLHSSTPLPRPVHEQKSLNHLWISPSVSISHFCNLVVVSLIFIMHCVIIVITVFICTCFFLVFLNFIQLFRYPAASVK